MLMLLLKAVHVAKGITVCCGYFVGRFFLKVLLGSIHRYQSCHLCVFIKLWLSDRLVGLKMIPPAAAAAGWIICFQVVYIFWLLIFMFFFAKLNFWSTKRLINYLSSIFFYTVIDRPSSSYTVSLLLSGSAIYSVPSD